jgi:hypothetical protein
VRASQGYQRVEYDRDVIDLRQVATGVVIGTMLLVFGLVPGLFQGFADGVRRALESFQNGNLLAVRFHSHPSRDVEASQPRWLAGIGAALIAGTLIGYLLN